MVLINSTANAESWQVMKKQNTASYRTYRVTVDDVTIVRLHGGVLEFRGLVMSNLSIFSLRYVLVVSAAEYHTYC